MDSNGSRRGILASVLACPPAAEAECGFSTARFLAGLAAGFAEDFAGFFAPRVTGFAFCAAGFSGCVVGFAAFVTAATAGFPALEGAAGLLPVGAVALDGVLAAGAGLFAAVCAAGFALDLPAVTGFGVCPAVLDASSADFLTA